MLKPSGSFDIPQVYAHLDEEENAQKFVSGT